MFVSGVGGTGKSFLIEAIKALIGDIWPTNDLTCAVVMFVGDLLQLPPVNGTPVFENITQKSLSYKLGCATSVNIW